MLTTTPYSSPIPSERRLLQLLEGGQVNTKLAGELLDGMGKTQKTARAVMTFIECEPTKRVTFAEAVNLLRGKLELETARTDAVQSHGRWGLVDALINAGTINNADEYGALFDKATINISDLFKVRESLKSGKKVLPIFDAGGMNPYELFAVLFTKGGVPNFRETYGYRNMVRLRRLDPKDIHNLRNLHNKSYKEQCDTFKAAYEKADHLLEPTGPRVTFTPDELEATHVSTSTVQDMQAHANGEISFIDPNSDFLRYRMQMDAGLCKLAGRRDNLDDMSNEDYKAILDKAFTDGTMDEYMPDSKGKTRYPNYAFENGGAPCLEFRTAYRMIFLDSYNPHVDYDYQGSRISLG